MAAVQVLGSGGASSDGEPSSEGEQDPAAPAGACAAPEPLVASSTTEARLLTVPTGARGGAPRLSGCAPSEEAAPDEPKSDACGDDEDSDDAPLDTLQKRDSASSRSSVDKSGSRCDLKRSHTAALAEAEAKRSRTAEPAKEPEEEGDEQFPSSQPAASAEGCAMVEGLPAEAHEEWTVAEDVCSLQVVGTTMKLPQSVHSKLYSFQRQGIIWMWNLFHQEFGGILADEMGLGKTVQCAAFLSSLKFTEQASRFLIVTPVSLLEQWRRELRSWAAETGIAVHLLHGTAAERKAALRGFASKSGALLVSYDLLRNLAGSLRTAGLACSSASGGRKRRRQDNRGCRDDDSPSEGDEPPPVADPAGVDPAMPWDVVIVDEGHYIKNPSCQVGKALRRLEARSRFLLTGTPVQNKLGDLWALMDFVQPSLLGNHATFEKNFSEQIAKGSKRHASRFAVELKDQLARELRRLTAPHFLRRLKAEVALPVSESQPAADAAAGAGLQQELPPKTDVVLWLSQTHAELDLYKMVLNTDLVRSASGSSKCGMEALRAIALLKKLCNHPLLLLPPEELAEWRRQVSSGSSLGQEALSEAAASLAAAATQEEAEDAAEADGEAPECRQALPRLRAMVPNSVQGGALLSCKLRVLSVLLPQLHKRGHRCLIFSQSIGMLDLIQSCVLRVLGLKFLRIDGSVEAKERDIKLAKFSQPDSRYFCMCLSVQTGGTGLTITAADRVILVDPAWNPSADAQAIDRVHRFGQRKDVVVYRLITAGTMEDKMFRLQVFKKGVSKTYLEQEQQMRFFSHKELKQLFEPPSQAASTQALMAEQIGAEALEHEGLLQTVAGDLGGADDPDASEFWQGCDVQGFSDYQRLFMFLERNDAGEGNAVSQAKAMAGRLRNEEYVKDQVVDNKWRKNFLDAQAAAAAEADDRECEGE